MKPPGPGQTEKQERQGNHMAIYTDIAPEIYPPGRGRVPEGVRCTVHQAGACRITRVRIERDGLARPAGHYVTVETPRVAVLDDQDEKLTALLAREVAEMLPPGPVLVHCWHGADRTGMVVALYRMVEQGWTREAAIEEMLEGGYGYHSVWKDIITFLETVDVEALRRALRSNAAVPGSPEGRARRAVGQEAAHGTRLLRYAGQAAQPGHVERLALEPSDG